MSLTYEILKRAVKLTGMKKRMEMSAAEIIAVKKKENRRNAIPDLQDDEMDITVTSVSGFPAVSGSEGRLESDDPASERGVK